MATGRSDPGDLRHGAARGHRCIPSSPWAARGDDHRRVSPTSTTSKSSGDRAAIGADCPHRRGQRGAGEQNLRPGANRTVGGGHSGLATQVTSPEAALSMAFRINRPLFTVGMVQRGYRDEDIQKVLRQERNAPPVRAGRRLAGIRASLRCMRIWFAHQYPTAESERRESDHDHETDSSINYFPRAPGAAGLDRPVIKLAPLLPWTSQGIQVDHRGEVQGVEFELEQIGWLSGTPRTSSRVALVGRLRDARPRLREIQCPLRRLRARSWAANAAASERLGKVREGEGRLRFRPGLEMRCPRAHADAEGRCLGCLATESIHMAWTSTGIGASGSWSARQGHGGSPAEQHRGHGNTLGDVVMEWEIWNEPGQGRNYATLR